MYYRERNIIHAYNVVHSITTSLNMICIFACESLGTSDIAVILLSVEGRILEEIIQTCLFNIETEPHPDWVIHTIKGL